jgi:hypothetical protein
MQVKILRNLTSSFRLSNGQMIRQPFQGTAVGEGEGKPFDIIRGNLSTFCSTEICIR